MPLRALLHVVFLGDGEKIGGRINGVQGFGLRIRGSSTRFGERESERERRTRN